MLAKLETAYLGILRVVILIVATISLVAAGLALATAIPPLLRVIGGSATEVPKPSLGAFIQEKKVEGTTSTTSTTDDASGYVDPDLKAAAADLKRYLGRDSPVTAENLQEAISKDSDSIPVGHLSDYYQSLHHLTDELLASKGKPLTLERVGELLQWHEQRFIAAVNDADAQRAADRIKTGYTLSLAGGAFLFFTLIVFIFLFVKIERSLRVVRTERVEDRGDYA